MALADLLARLERRAADTPDTSCNRGEVSANPAPIQACTLDTPDTRQNGNTAGAARKVGTNRPAAKTSWGWRVTYPEGHPGDRIGGRGFECFVIPELTFAEARLMYPGAKIEPIAEVSE